VGEHKILGSLKNKIDIEIILCPPGVAILIFAFFGQEECCENNCVFDPFDRILAFVFFYKSHHTLKISIISLKVSSQKILDSLKNKIDFKIIL